MFTYPICHMKEAEAGGQQWPATAGAMVTLGLPSPTAIYTCDEASGSLLDQVGSNDLVEQGTGCTYRQTPSAPYDGKYAIESPNAASGWWKVATATNIDPGLGSAAYLVVCEIPASGGVTDIVRVEGTANRIQTNSSPLIRIKEESVNHNGTTNVSSTVVPILWVIDRNATTSVAYTNDDQITCTYSAADMSGGTAGLSGVAGSKNIDIKILYYAIWIGANAEGMGKADLEAFWDAGLSY